jgi:hypothetical protein
MICSLIRLHLEVEPDCLRLDIDTLAASIAQCVMDRLMREVGQVMTEEEAANH